MCELAARPDYLARARCEHGGDTTLTLPFARRAWTARAPGLLVLLLLFLCTTRARADESDELARAHYIAGEAYFAEGRFPEAAREFDEAYRASSRPEMLINLSRAEERAGSLPNAIAALEQLLSRRADMDLRREAESALARLRELDRKRRIALAAELAEEEASSESAVAPPAAPAGEPRSESADPGRAGVRWPTLVVAGGAVASAVTALVTGLVAHAKYNELEQRCPEGACSAQWSDEQAQGQRLARASSALTVSAVVLGGVTAALWVFDLRRADHASRAARPRSSYAGQARLGVRSSATAHEATIRFDF